jgi:hypothetical protein
MATRKTVIMPSYISAIVSPPVPFFNSPVNSSFVSGIYPIIVSVLVAMPWRLNGALLVYATYANAAVINP